MKKQVFVALFALMAIALAGCKNEKSVPFRQYLMNVEIVDQNGVNLLQDYPVGTCQAMSVDAFLTQGERKLLGVRNGIDKKDSVNYLNTDGTYLYDPKIDFSKVSWQFKSKEIFGDEKLHILESQWDLEPNRDSRLQCTKSTFDGIECQVTQKPIMNVVRIVVTR